MNKEKLQNRINKILNNQFNIDDVQLLFYDIREQSLNNIVREIGDFIHSERDRGMTHQLIKKTANDIIEGFLNGGGFEIKNLTDYQDLVSVLDGELKRQGFQTDLNKLNEVKNKFCEYVIDFLDEKILKINVNQILECKLKKTRLENGMALHALLRPKDDISGVIRWYKNVDIGIPVIIPKL